VSVNKASQRIRYLHRSAIGMQLQHTMGLKSTSNRMNGCELIIAFLRRAIVSGD